MHFRRRAMSNLDVSLHFDTSVDMLKVYSHIILMVTYFNLYENLVIPLKNRANTCTINPNILFD